MSTVDPRKLLPHIVTDDTWLRGERGRAWCVLMGAYVPNLEMICVCAACGRIDLAPDDLRSDGAPRVVNCDRRSPFFIPVYNCLERLQPDEINPGTFVDLGLRALGGQLW